MDVLGTYQELKLHGGRAQEHFQQALRRSEQACQTYGTSDDVVVCMQKGGELVHRHAANYLAKNLKLAKQLQDCLSINQEKDPAAWKTCLADVKSQMLKLSYKD